MDIEFLTNADAPPPPPTAAYSHAVRSGDFLFVTGQLGVDPKTGTLVQGGAAEQTRQIMQNLEIVLRGAGTSLERAVMVRIYLVNFSADYPVVNAVYALGLAQVQLISIAGQVGQALQVLDVPAVLAALWALAVDDCDLAGLGYAVRSALDHGFVDALLDDLVADVVRAVDVETLLVETEADGARRVLHQN